MVHTDLHLVNVRMPLLSETDLFEIEVERGMYKKVRRQEEGLIRHEATTFWDGRIAEGAPTQGRTLVSDKKEISVDELTSNPFVEYWDLGGRIILPGMVDAHMHLDKSFSYPQVGNHSGTLQEAVRNYAAAMPQFSKEEVRKRILRAALMALSHGTTRIRSHIDFPSKADDPDLVFRGLEAAFEVKEKLSPFVEIQLFPMPGYGLNKRSMELLEEALKMGATGVGGAPHLSPTPSEDIQRLFEIAVRYDKPLDLHTDEQDDPNVNTLSQIIAETEGCDYQGSVVVDHLCSLSAMEEEKAFPLIERMKTCDIRPVTLPAANFYLQGREDRGLVRRGITRVREMLAAGLPVTTASDNIHDPFHPFGKGDLLQIGLLTAYAAHMGSPDEQRTLLKMITEFPAALMGVDGYTIKEGNCANFVLLDASSVEEIWTMLPENRWVYLNGGWVSQSYRQLQWGSGLDLSIGGSGEWLRMTSGKM